MNINRKTGFFLLLTGVLMYTGAIAPPASVAKSITPYSSASLMIAAQAANPSAQLQAKIEELRQEITRMLVNDLELSKGEAAHIISVAKYLTPSGRDINKVIIVNGKLQELLQLESKAAK